MHGQLIVWNRVSYSKPLEGTPMVRKTFHDALFALILLSGALNLRPAASDAATPALPQAQNVVVGVNLSCGSLTESGRMAIAPM
jgi:hypothetical protein